MYHPINGSVEKIWKGFSWPCLFFGFIWFGVKGMWGWVLVSLALAFCTFGVSWLALPFFANRQHEQFLIRQGYLNEKQWDERKQVNSNITNTESRNTNIMSVVDEIAKLGKLRDEGLLNDEEFIKQKNKLLS